MIKRMFMYLGIMTLLCGLGIGALAYNEYHRVPDKTQQVAIPCEAFKGDVNVVVTVEVTNMALTKENIELLTKKVCGAVVKKII